MRFAAHGDRLGAGTLRVDRVDDRVRQDEVGRRGRGRGGRGESKDRERRGEAERHRDSSSKRETRSIAAVYRPAVRDARRRAPGEFDTFLFADYSGAASPSAQRRAIALWRLDRGGRPRKVGGPFTRETLREALLRALVEATRAGRRVLFGIDHQWSWPRDLWGAAGLAGRPWRAALRSLVDGEGGRPPLGPAHVFPAAFNAWAGAAIFHCRVKGLARAYGMPTTRDWRGDPVRLAERAMPGAKPATRLGGTGAVAGQTLVGLVELHRLLEDARRLGSRSSPGRWTRSRTTDGATSAPRSTRASAGRPTSARRTTPTRGGPASGPRGPTSPRPST